MSLQLTSINAHTGPIVVFDIVGSTAIIHELQKQVDFQSDSQKMADYIGKVLINLFHPVHTLKDEIHNGFIISYTGDGIILSSVFNNLPDADKHLATLLNRLTQISRTYSSVVNQSWMDRIGTKPLGLKTTLGYGDIFCFYPVGEPQCRNYIGDELNVACRINKETSANCISVSARAHSALNSYRGGFTFASKEREIQGIGLTSWHVLGEQS